MPGASRAAERKHLMASNAAICLGCCNVALCRVTALTCMLRGCGRDGLSTRLPTHLAPNLYVLLCWVLGQCCIQLQKRQPQSPQETTHTASFLWTVNTHFQSLNPEALVMFKYCRLRYLRQCLLLDGNREGNKHYRCDCAQLCDWAVQHLHRPKRNTPRNKVKTEGVPDPAIARCIQ